MKGCGLAEIGDGIVAHVGSAPGDPVLWIHGYTMDSRVWKEIWSRLDGWCHIGIDLPGHGLSVNARPDLALIDLARGIGAFAMQRGARHLVGLSFGGMVALQVAMEFPDAFSTLALGAPALGGGPQDRRAQAINIDLTRMFRERGSGPWLSDLWMSPHSGIFAGIARQPLEWSRLRRIVADHQWPELADGRMQHLTMHHQQPWQLDKIGAATLVLVGDEDSETFKRSAELIRRAIPRCRRVYLERTGHLTILERPETVHALLDDHFRATLVRGHAQRDSNRELTIGGCNGWTGKRARGRRDQDDEPHHSRDRIARGAGLVGDGVDRELHPACARAAARS
jgi:pimeloyl-ACP methyl ester carboxylesterase